MSRLNFRRFAAVAAGALLGLGGVATFAAPASAHYTEPAGQAICDTATGEWVVTWTVKSVYHFDSKTFKLTSVNLTPENTTVTNIVKTKGNQYPHDVNTPLTGVQRVPGSATKASLAVKAKWNDGYAEHKAQKRTVTLGGSCVKDEPPASPSPTPTPTPTPTTPPAVSIPTASFASDCTGAVTVTLANGAEATTDATLTVSAKDFKKTFTLKPGESKSDIVVPAKAGKITITEGEKPVGEPYTWVSPEECVEPGKPQVGYESTCDKLVFGFANPEDGKTFEVTLTPNKGEPQKRTVEPGQTVLVEFEAFEGLTVTPSGEGLDDTSTIAWEKPAECNPGQGGGDEGPALPVTGAATGGIIAGAAVLLAAGVALFVIARRRKVRFTA